MTPGVSCVKDAFGISQPDKPWKVRLLFAREVATCIRDRVRHASQELRQRQDCVLDPYNSFNSRRIPLRPLCLPGRPFAYFLGLLLPPPPPLVPAVSMVALKSG